MKIAIIGAGIAGLRAAVEIAKNPQAQVTIFEKSRSVGGRVATRRFPSSFVNHGATTCNNIERIKAADSLYPHFIEELKFLNQATLLAKKLKTFLPTSYVKMRIDSKVSSVSAEGLLQLENAEELKFDKVILTAPMPQNRELLGHNLLPEITYKKCLLFIGEEAGTAARIEMSEEWSELHFEMSDAEITHSGEVLLGKNLQHLTVKKWRYAEVKSGFKQSYYVQGNRLFLAGDAFDPLSEYGVAAAWLSGLAVANVVNA